MSLILGAATIQDVQSPIGGGAVESGDSYVISGSGFGAKGGTNANKALAYCDMSINDFSGTSFTATADFVPDPAVSHLSVYGKGSTHDPFALGVTTALPAPGETHSLDFKQGEMLQRLVNNIRWGHKISGGPTRFYIFVKRYYDYTHAQVGNMKTIRFWQPVGGSTKSLFTARGSNSGGSIEFAPIGPGGPGPDDDNTNFLSRGLGTHPRNEWFVDEFIYIQNTADDVYDGECKIYKDNFEVFKSGFTGDGFYAMLVDGNVNEMEEFWTQQNFANDPIGTWADERVYWNNWYFDDTLARVMITDNATYQPNVGAENVVEVQPPTAWSDTEITVRFRKGALLTGDNHVHVFDTNDVSQYIGTIDVA